jgi:hypothetical protein
MEYVDSPSRITSSETSTEMPKGWSKKHKARLRSTSPTFSDDEAPLHTPRGNSPQPPRGKAVTHAQMCVMADFYGIETLATFAREQLVLVMEEVWDTEEFVDTLDLVCRPPLDGDSVLQAYVVGELSRHQSLLDKPEIEAILKLKPDILYILIQGLRHDYKSTW